MNGTLAGGATAPTRVAAARSAAPSRSTAATAEHADGAATKLDLTNGMTLEAWVNPTSMSGWETVVYKERGGAGTGLLSYALYAHDGGANTPPAGYVSTSAAGPDRGIQGPSRLTLNTWSHIAVTYTTAAAPGRIDAALLRQRRAHPDGHHAGTRTSWPATSRYGSATATRRSRKASTG